MCKYCDNVVKREGFGEPIYAEMSIFNPNKNIKSLTIALADEKPHFGTSKGYSPQISIYTENDNWYDMSINFCPICGRMLQKFDEKYRITLTEDDYKIAKNEDLPISDYLEQKYKKTMKDFNNQYNLDWDAFKLFMYYKYSEKGT